MKCRFCKTNIEHTILDLGSTAVSNNLIRAANISASEIIYPLVLQICIQCFLVQIDEQVSAEEIFDKDYVYFSSASSFWLKHAKDFSEKMIHTLKLDDKSFVVEVASNDGYLLKNFVANGIKCLGIEPAQSTAYDAITKAIPTIVEFFDSNLAESLVAKEKKADLIIANNVLAHVPNINDFVLAFQKLLKPEGTISIEFPHVMKMIEHNEFDTIYHEHFFYFSLLTLKIIFKKYGLSIYDVEELYTHGGSLRIYLTHENSAVDRKSDKENVCKILSMEESYGLDSIDYYNKLYSNAFKIKLDSLNYFLQKKKEDKSIIAFGAAAKGNTFLNYCGIKKDFIDFVVDETPSKIGKIMPQSGIPIVSFDNIKEQKPDVIVILPWNHKDEILAKLNFTQDWRAEIVTFIPKLTIHT